MSRALVQKYIDGLLAGDLDGVAAVIHEEYSETYPQSGETVSGAKAWREMMDAFPGLPVGEESHTTGGDKPTTLVSAGLPIGPPTISVFDGGSSFTNESVVEYPNGERYHIVVVGEIKDAKIYRSRMYWASGFDVPEWRAPFTDVASR